MTLYKLTDAEDRTYNKTLWGEGVTHEASGEGSLCGPGWLHAYTDPLLAVMLNPIHGAFEWDMHLWECEGEVGAEDSGLKVGCRRLTTIRRMEVPAVTIIQRAAFAILCARRVYHDPAWNAWADAWLSGVDRSEKAAWAAADAAWAAGDAAWAAAAEAAEAARAAVWAAADAAREAEAAGDAAWAAEAAAAAAEAADAMPLDLAGLAREAMSYE